MAKLDAESIASDEGATRTTSTASQAERVTVSLSPDDDSPDGGEASAFTPVREGDVLSGKYRVEVMIGGGGMGVVFAATHLHLHTRVALKVLRPDVERGGVAVARLLREARACARIQAEHVVRVLDVGSLDTGAPYIVMEHLTGRDLRVELRARGPLGVEDAVEYVLHACEAVAQAHAAGIVHRDLKPSNLFLTRGPDGAPCVKVLDFGIAKALDDDGAGDEPSLTTSRAFLGSPMYMSPEQIRSAKTVDTQTDVWALGLILFELLTGSRPFTGGSVSARLAAIAADPPILLRTLRPEAPAGLEEAILRCLEKDPARRTPGVAALARALAPFAPPRAAGSIERVEAWRSAPLPSPDGDRQTPLPVPRPRRSRMALGAALAMLVAGAATAYGIQATRARPVRDDPGDAEALSAQSRDDRTPTVAAPAADPAPAGNVGPLSGGSAEASASVRPPHVPAGTPGKAPRYPARAAGTLVPAAAPPEPPAAPPEAPALPAKKPSDDIY
jgi:eukaryotic-like serine/threonine-protein kinase